MGSGPPSWFYYLQSAGIVVSFLLAAYALWRNTASQRLTNLLAITVNHRTLWSQVITEPKLGRVLDPKADLQAQPITLEERLFVVQLIMHLQAAFYAQDTSVIEPVEGMYHDVGDFFRLPIPAEVWHNARALQNERFVRYVDRCLSAAAGRRHGAIWKLGIGIKNVKPVDQGADRVKPTEPGPPAV